MIMTNITPHIEMRTKVIYSFKSEIHRDAGEIVDYSKTLTSPPGMFTGLGRFKHLLKNVSKTVRFGERRGMVKSLFTRHKNN